MVHTISLVAVFCNFQVVDDGDGVIIPADDHGADSGPGSLLCIELQDVVIGVGVVKATCIVLYYYTNCMGNVTTQIMSSHQGVTVRTCYYNFIIQSGAPQTGPG